MATIKKAQKGMAVKKTAPKMMAGEMTGKMYKKSEIDEIGKKQAAELDKSGVFGKSAMAKKKAPKAMYGKTVKKAKDGSFPDLNKDGKVTKADILKGRGVIAKKGAKVAKKAMPCATCGKSMKKK
jgi:phosphoribosylamine-glycine ligase